MVLHFAAKSCIIYVVQNIMQGGYSNVGKYVAGVPGLLHRPVRPGGGRHRRIGAAELRGRKRCIDFGNAGGGGDYPDTGGWIPGEIKLSSSAHRAGLWLVHGIKIRAGQSPALRRYRKAIFYRAFSRPVASLNSLISSSNSLAWAWTTSQVPLVSYHWAFRSSTVMPCCSTQV